MSRVTRAGLVIAVVAAIAGCVFAAVWLATALLAPPTAAYDPRPWLLCAGLVVLSIGTYAVWLDRWNVVGHTQLAFSVVAYVIPIFGLHQLDNLNANALDVYYKIVVAGAFVYVAGIALGAALVSDAQIFGIRHWVAFDNERVMQVVRDRTFRIGILSVIGVLASFAIMGFIPAFASDPLLAKFFRGPYAAPYARVAPLYRLATAGIATVLPLIAVFAFRRKSRLAWRVLLVTSIGVLALALTRQAALNGLLLLLGVVVAVKRRSLFGYFAVLIGVYVFGAISYTVLNAIGLKGFVAVPGANAQSFLNKAAAGAPDLKDHVRFLLGYLQYPLPAHGRTFWGGLLPNHYEWNSSVYSLSVANPGQDVSRIQSGGLRLPAPIWGYANFGWMGVVTVSFVSGVFSGYLARLFRALTPSDAVTVSMCWITLYSTLLLTLPVFYRSQYLSVLQLVIVLWLLVYRTRQGEDRSATRQSIAVP